jgi:hypothetical protein
MKTKDNMKCTAPLSDFCSSEETWPDCENCKYWKDIEQVKTQESINYKLKPCVKNKPN